jgi:hypothetical protein
MDNPRQHRSCILGIHGRGAGAALTLAILLVAALLATGSAQGQSWSDNFDSDPLGSNPPPGWDSSGNTSAIVVNSTSVSSPNSVQMYGVVGGCWSALIHRQLEVKPPFTIQMYVRNGGEPLSGCHPTRADAKLQTGPSWTYPLRVLWDFNANGEFIVPGATTGPSFPALTWVKVGVSYELSDATHVRMNYSLNDQFYKSVTTTQDSYESQLAWLSLESGEGTAWYDSVSVTAGFLINPPCTLTDSASYDANNATLTMKFIVGNNLGTTANWSAWLTYADPQGTNLDTMQTLFSVSQPITNPPKAITKTLAGLPKEGNVGVLSTLSTPHLSTAKTEGIACSSWVQVKTGTEP